MSATLQKIVVLNSYCRDSQPLYATLGNELRSFDRTVVEARQQVLAQGQKHDEDNFFIEWSQRKPHILRAVEDGVTSPTQFELELRLECKLATTMLEDLRRLAESKMADDIRRENEAKIGQQAKDRVEEMLMAVANLMAEVQN